MRITPLLAMLLLAPFPAQGGEPPALLRPALEALCAQREAPSLAGLGAALGGLFPLEEETQQRGIATGWSGSLAGPEGGELRFQVIFSAGAPQRLTVEVYEPAEKGLRPAFLAIAGGNCALQAGRGILYDGAGRRHLLVHFVPGEAPFTLAPLDLQEPLNPPVPEGRDPGGVRVALFDSGLAYDLPLFAGRLARDEKGLPLAYDFAEEDERPYDGNTKRSPFFPIRHGTPVASIFAREAPEAALIPYRFDPHDLSKMAGMVTAADAAGARIVSMPMGSNDPNDWVDFEREARARPHMLFVLSAGNSGIDIDREHVYPASLPNENFLVVTSSTPEGRLAPDVNFGAVSVDLMVPGENQPVVDFRGAEGRASGTSYAVPRVAALAARLLAANPGWGAKELKAAILARAAPSPFQVDAPVGAGWIGNPQEDR